MKKNLLKILATMAIVVTLGACGRSNNPSESSSPESSESEGEKTLELDLDGLQVIDDEPDESNYFPFTNAGKLVRISDLCLCEQLDSKTYIVNWNGDTTGGDEMGGVQVVLSEAIDDAEYGEKVAVEGRATDVNGRIVIKDAKFISREKRTKDDQGQRISGASMYYRAKSIDRSAFQQYCARANSGVLFDASAPQGDESFIGIITKNELTQEGGVLKYVLPGENPENEELELFAKFGALSEEEWAELSTVEAGDLMSFVGFTEYDNSVAGSHKGVVLNGAWWCEYDFVDESALPETYKTWKAATDQYAEEFKFGIPAIEDQEGVYSYAVNDDYILNCGGFWNDAGKALLKIDYAKAGLLDININYDSDEAFDDGGAVDAMLDNLEELDFSIAQNSYGYIVATANQDTTAPTVVTTEIWLSKGSDTSLSMQFMTLLAPVTDTIMDLLNAAYTEDNGVIAHAFAEVMWDGNVGYEYSESYPTYAKGGFAAGNNHFYTWGVGDEGPALTGFMYKGAYDAYVQTYGLGGVFGLFSPAYLPYALNAAGVLENIQATDQTFSIPAKVNNAALNNVLGGMSGADGWYGTPFAGGINTLTISVIKNGILKLDMNVDVYEYDTTTGQPVKGEGTDDWSFTLSNIGEVPYAAYINPLIEAYEEAEEASESESSSAEESARVIKNKVDYTNIIVR